MNGLQTPSTSNLMHDPEAMGLEGSARQYKHAGDHGHNPWPTICACHNGAHFGFYIENEGGIQSALLNEQCHTAFIPEQISRALPRPIHCSLLPLFMRAVRVAVLKRIA